jgi:hypothetical protein
MASHAALEPQLRMADIPEPMRISLAVQETATEFLVRTFSGATLHHPKSSVHYWWQLLRGVWDSGTDTTEERSHERAWELAHDKRKFGTSAS